MESLYKIIIALLIALICVLCLYFFISNGRDKYRNECALRHGIMVETIDGLQCLKVERVKWNQ